MQVNAKYIYHMYIHDIITQVLVRRIIHIHRNSNSYIFPHERTAH